VYCDRGCERTIKALEVPYHDCVTHLRGITLGLDCVYDTLEQNILEVRKDIGNLNEKSELVKTAANNKIQEMNHNLTQLKEEIVRMRQGHDMEIVALESDSKSTIEFYRETAPDKFKGYFKF
jgi:acetyl-CoA carboxylase alpha subunit